MKKVKITLFGTSKISYNFEHDSEKTTKNEILKKMKNPATSFKESIQLEKRAKLERFEVGPLKISELS